MSARPGGEKRGNSKDRRNRKLWLLSSEAGFGGNGEKVPCVHCDRPLAYEEVEADRKVPGGSYGFSKPYPNVQPSCGPCNKSRSNRASWVNPLGVLVLA